MPVQAITHYIKASIEELKRVSWPTRTQIWHGTLMVVCISVGVALFLGITDFLLTRGLQKLL